MGKSFSLSLENEEFGSGGGLGLIFMLLENSQQIPTQFSEMLEGVGKKKRVTNGIPLPHLVEL